MSPNYPLRVLITSLIIFAILIIGSQPSTQLALVQFFGLDQAEITTLAKQSTRQKTREEVTINRVIDGDTVLLQDGRTVRYLNIDTPETKKPNTPVQCYGKEASDFNRGLTEGKTVTIVAEKELQDRYGRELRFIFLKGKNVDDITQSVNAQMVQKGFARSSIYSPNNRFEKEFISLEQSAQKKDLGVWKCPKPFEE
jgi:micrococcal nuclease